MAKKDGAKSRRPAGLAPDLDLPQGIKVEVRESFPPNLDASISQARTDGRYFIAVVRQVNDSGELSIETARAQSFNPDFLMRGWHEVAKKIVDGTLAGRPLVDGSNLE